MAEYFRVIHDWIIQPGPWAGAGPVWQMFGVVLVTLTMLQTLPNDWAGGIIFSRRGLWITLILDALWVYLIFVSPFIPISATVALLIVGVLGALAIFAWNRYRNEETVTATVTP